MLFRSSDLRFVSCWPMFDSTRGPIGVVKRRCARGFWHAALREVSGAIDGSSLRAWRDRWVVAPCVARSMGRGVSDYSDCDSDSDSDSSYERNAEETLLVLCQGLLSSSSHCRRVSCPPLPRRPWRRRAAVRMEAQAGPFRVVVFQVCACLAECTKHTHTTRKLSKTASFNESFDSRIRQSCPEVAWG